jgi:hypothetical protein
VRRRDLAVVAACLALAWLGMRGARVPVLGLVDLGFHELGHLVCYVIDAFLPWPEVATAAAGSVVQVAVPAGLATYFIRRSDRLGGAFCLAWAATSAHDVARYVADAPYERLPQLGRHHDWANVLGPDHLDALHLAGLLADAIRLGGWLLLLTALLVAAQPLLATPPATTPRRVL